MQAFLALPPGSLCQITPEYRAGQARCNQCPAHVRRPSHPNAPVVTPFSSAHMWLAQKPSFPCGCAGMQGPAGPRSATLKCL
jgi:hypothetical protein